MFSSFFKSVLFGILSLITVVLIPMAQAQTVDGQPTVIEFLDRGLTPEQLTEKDNYSQNITEKTLKELGKSMAKTGVYVAEEQMPEIKKLIREASHIEWSIQRVYRKLAYRHSAQQVELGNERLSEIRQELDTLLAPLNAELTRHSKEMLRDIFLKEREEKAAIARGETIKYPEPKPFIPKVLSPEDKTALRAKRTAKITKLMNESGLTVSASDFEHYIGYGERNFDRHQIGLEHKYYSRYRGTRSSFDLPSFKKFKATLGPSLTDTRKLTLITGPLEIARLDKLKDEIVRQKMDLFVKEFEAAKYDYTQQDVMRMSQISWEMDRLQHERRLIISKRQESGKKGLGGQVSTIDSRKRALKKDRSAIKSRLYYGR